MTVTALALVPRDGFFCKDGRGWMTSATGRSHALDWPWPSTVLGALRNAWGRAYERAHGTVLSPTEWEERTRDIQLRCMLAMYKPHRVSWSFEHTMWPVPTDALYTKTQPWLRRLEPEEPDVQTLGRNDNPARERLWRPRLSEREKPVAPPRWWSAEDFVAWLAGRDDEMRQRQLGDGRLRTPLRGPSRRFEIRLQIDPDTLTAKEGRLFTRDIVETHDGSGTWAIGVTMNDVLETDLVFLAGSSRIAQVERLDANLFDVPDKLSSAFGSGVRGLRLIAVTPLCFERGWLPDGFECVEGRYLGTLPGVEDRRWVLRAALVPRPLHVTGWDIAHNRPKPVRRMVAPGAVYFFEPEDGRELNADVARKLWLAAMGQHTHEGFGTVVPGVWHR